VASPATTKSAGLKTRHYKEGHGNAIQENGVPRGLGPRILLLPCSGNIL
jgi:hypothetical protein